LKIKGIKRAVGAHISTTKKEDPVSSQKGAKMGEIKWPSIKQKRQPDPNNAYAERQSRTRGLLATNRGGPSFLHWGY